GGNSSTGRRNKARLSPRGSRADPCALVAGAPLRILLLHPHKCGGVRPVCRLGLRKQYTRTVLWLNLLLLLLIWVYEKPMTSFGEVMVAGSAAYLILGPVIFMAPLLPFRAAMQNAKRDRIHEFARALRVETERIRKQLKTDAFSEEDSKSIERLR